MSGVSDRNAAWRQQLRRDMPGKERTSIERVRMPEVDPVERIKSQRIEEMCIRDRFQDTPKEKVGSNRLFWSCPNRFETSLRMLAFNT